MDKNTLTGLLLIGALLMGFMYCNRPEPNELKENAVNSSVPETVDNNLRHADANLRAEMIDAAKRYGTLDTVSVPGKQTYNVELSNVKYSVSLGQDTVFAGTANVDNTTIDLAAAMGGDESKSTPEANVAAMNAVRDAIAKHNTYGSLAKYMGGEEKTITVKNNNFNISFSSHGAAISNVTLNNYTTELGKKGKIVAYDNKNGGMNFEIQTSSNRLNTAELNFEMSQPNDSTVLMSLPLSDNAMIGVQYVIDAKNYLVKMNLIQKNIATALPSIKPSVNLTWTQDLQRNEVGRTFEERFSGIYYKMDGENPDDLDNYSDDSEDVKGNIRWIAFKNQFFSSVLIAKNDFTAADLNSTMIKEGNTLKKLSAKATFNYNSNSENAAEFVFFFGPNNYPLLSDLDDALTAYAPQDDSNLQLNKLVNVGWGIFGWINRFVVIPVFSFLSGFISNYGIIILLLTIFIKIILFPLTYKSYMSQAKMRVLAPEIKEINEKYADDALKKQQETMKLYSKAGASPFSGCLPMLLQMPILIAMFSFFPSAIELRGQSFLWVHDLSAPDYLFELPFSIPFLGNHLSLFCLLMTATNIIYTRINMQNQPTSSSMPGMKWMMYLMPVMFLFFFNDYAAGLSYYYFLSLLITIVQTYAFRYFIDEKKVREQMIENAKKPRKKSGFMARLEAAQKKQEAMMREQAKQNARRRH